MPTVAAAQPFAYDFPREKLGLVVIDMQRDFVEPGGFGDSLGNDVMRLQAIVPTVAKLIDGFRRNGPPEHREDCWERTLAWFKERLGEAR